MESVIRPVAVATAWYEYKLLLGAVAQVRKFHYLRMRSSKNDRKTGPAKTGPAGPLATAVLTRGLCVGARADPGVGGDD